MARKARFPSLSSTQASYVLEKLIHEGKVAAADISRHLGSIGSEIRNLEKRLSDLRDDMPEPIKHPVRAARTASMKVTKVAKKVRKRVLSAQAKASQQIQGQYLGYMQQIRKSARAKYKVIAKKLGREKAIVAMKNALGK
ncbi:MAG: hypothetical protein ACXW3E_06545 [Thermoanaerobaculia bacterium]|jgi:O6-methylguanine-DNA--protein-cysteine methyltransferase